MALDRLTKIDGGGISTTSDYRVGIITASKFVGPFDGSGGNFSGVVTATSANFTGNVTIGGTLTYEDVTNIDSVGIITAREAIDCNGDLDVDGHTNLDNVSVAGVSTFTGNINSIGNFTISNTEPYILLQDTNNNDDFIVRNTNGVFTIRDATNGADRLTIDSNGLATIGKITTPDFTGTGDFTISSTLPQILLEDTDNNDDFSIRNTNGVFTIRDATNGADRFTINSTGALSATGDTFIGNGSSTTLGTSATFRVANTGSSPSYSVFEAQSAQGSIRLANGGIFHVNGDLDVDGHTNLDNVSVAGVSTFSKNINLPDSSDATDGRIKFGATQDMMLFHYGGVNYIDVTTNLNIRGSSGGNTISIKPKSAEEGIKIIPDGAVELYHDGTKKFETTSNGAAVSNIQNNQGLDLIGVGNNTCIRFMSTGSSPAHAYRIAYHSINNYIYGSPALTFDKTDTSGNFDSHIAGISDGGFHLADNKKLHVGDKSSASGDLQIYHDGTDSWITNKTGNFRIGNTHNDEIKFSTQGNTRWNIDGSGHFVPDTAGAVNIGSATAEIGNVFLADSKKVFLGSDQDASIYHDGTHGYLTNTTGNLFVTNSGSNYTYVDSNFFRIRNSSGNHMFDVNSGGGHQGVGLYYSAGSQGTEKLRTSATGIRVTGEVAASQDYPNFRPTLDFNFAATKKLDPRITYRRTGPASFVNEFGKVVLVGDNVPRFDHDLDTGECKGLLIEESRTNIAPYSTDLSQYGSYNVTKTANNAVAPDGTTTAAKIEHGGSGTSYLDYIDNSINAQNAGPYTYSVWLKAPDDQPDGYYGCRIAVLHSTGGNVEPTVSLNKTWTRYSVTKTFGASDGGNLRVHLVMFRASPGSTYDGKVIPSYVWAWGAQIEQGAFATSYIPTAEATRGRDIVDVDGEDFTDFYNQTESTIISSHTLLQNVPNAENVYVYQIQDATTNNAIRVVDKNSSYSNVATGLVISGGSSVFHFNNTTDSFTKDKVLVALSVKNNDFAGCHNGGTIETDNSGTLPTNFNSLGIGRYPPSGGYELNGHIQRFIYYPKQLSDSQLKTLTA